MPRRPKRVSFFDADQGGKQWRPKEVVSQGAAIAADEAAAEGPAVAGLGCKTEGDKHENSDQDSNSSGPHSVLGDSNTDNTDGDDDHRSRGGSEDGPAELYMRTRDVRGDTVPANEILRSSRSGAEGSRKANEGNITCMFGNWGALPSANPALRRRVVEQLQHCPAQILILAECDMEMETILKKRGCAPGVASRGAAEGSAAAVAVAECASLVRRASYEFLTLRGREEHSLCVAARANVCSRVVLKYWERRLDGKYKKPSSGPTKNAYTRVMVARIEFDEPNAHFGKEITVCVVHMHHMTAKKQPGGGFRDSWERFWPFLAGLLTKHDCNILCGDFNMSLFCLVPQLRNHYNIQMETAACYFWKGLDGTSCVDSCGIWFVNCLGAYKLCQPLALVHADDPTGILYKEECVAGDMTFRNKSATAVAEDDTPPQSRRVVYNRHWKTRGPGKPLDCYIPKNNILQNVREFLKPTEESLRLQQQREKDAKNRAEAEARGDTSLTMKAFTPLFKARETRLHVEVWEVDGQAYGPAHFPLFVGTDFRAARSPQANKERHRKKNQRHQANVAQRRQEQQQEQELWPSQQSVRSPTAVAEGWSASYWSGTQDGWGAHQTWSASWSSRWAR